MKTELYLYDVFPKVFPEGREVRVTVKPLGRQSAFPGGPLRLSVCPLHERDYPLFEKAGSGATYEVRPEEDGCLRFSHVFQGEQEHYLRVFSGEKRLCQLSVYSLKEDLAGLMPLMGDLHLHTIRSDGREDPALVATHLRQRGYDFIAITDHRNFSGSLEAIDAFSEVPIGIHLLTGEEVHLPDCPIHVVHVGGRYSINAMVEENHALIDARNPGIEARFPAAWRSGYGSGFPGTLNDADFHQAVAAFEETLPPIPEELPRFVYAGFAFVCEQIRKAGGLAIFAHPYWINDLYHVDERLTMYIFQQKAFDAFEVLGGEMYYEQNGFQTAHYNQARAMGLSFPIVGSSDSHSSVNNPAAFIARTLCFAKANTTPAILQAIRDSLSVAVDQISSEPRLVGDYRLIKYGYFLMEHYFPLHDAACFEQGRAMKEYHCGDRAEGRDMLRLLDGRVGRLYRKYFAC